MLKPFSVHDALEYFKLFILLVGRYNQSNNQQNAIRVQKKCNRDIALKRHPGELIENDVLVIDGECSVVNRKGTKL